MGPWPDPAGIFLCYGLLVLPPTHPIWKGEMGWLNLKVTRIAVSKLWPEVCQKNPLWHGSVETSHSSCNHLHAELSGEPHLLHIAREGSVPSFLGKWLLGIRLCKDPVWNSKAFATSNPGMIILAHQIQPPGQSLEVPGLSGHSHFVSPLPWPSTVSEFRKWKEREGSSIWHTNSNARSWVSPIKT